MIAAGGWMPTLPYLTRQKRASYHRRKDQGTDAGSWPVLRTINCLCVHWIVASVDRDDKRRTLAWLCSVPFRSPRAGDPGWLEHRVLENPARVHGLPYQGPRERRRNPVRHLDPGDAPCKNPCFHDRYRPHGDSPGGTRGLVVCMMRGAGCRRTRRWQVRRFGSSPPGLEQRSTGSHPLGKRL
mgnify:CR=1 FL=1